LGVTCTVSVFFVLFFPFFFWGFFGFVWAGKKGFWGASWASVERTLHVRLVPSSLPSGGSLLCVWFCCAISFFVPVGTSNFCCEGCAKAALGLFYVLPAVLINFLLCNNFVCGSFYVVRSSILRWLLWGCRHRNAWLSEGCFIFRHGVYTYDIAFCRNVDHDDPTSPGFGDRVKQYPQGDIALSLSDLWGVFCCLTRPQVLVASCRQR